MRTKIPLANVQQKKGITLAVASSGIAANFLTYGKTTKSAFKLPINLTSSDSATYNISKDMDKADVLKRCEIIVYDECTMTQKEAFEALHRTARYKGLSTSNARNSCASIRTFQENSPRYFSRYKDVCCESMHQVITSVATCQIFAS